MRPKVAKNPNPIHFVQIVRFSSGLCALKNLETGDYGINGVKQNYAKVRDYYEQGAIKGNASALNGLGYLYHHGLGVKRDYTKARKYYEQAAAKGHAKALFHLGWLYEYGKGVNIDYEKALDYYQQAANIGHQGAVTAAEELRVKLNG